MRSVWLPGVLLVCLPVLLHAQVSPFNGLSVEPPPPGGSYRMIISGHLHGSSRDMSGYPASTLLAGLDAINASGAHVFLSTGDLFLDPAREKDQYERAFFSRLRIPLFNAPGNHDHGSLYEREYGPTFSSFGLGRDRIVLLDTERRDGSLDGDQIAMLEQLLSGEAPKRIFIISHRPIWSEGDDRYGPLFEGNTRSFTGTNYRRTVEPLLERLAQRSEVHWISGSMAGRARTSFFFAAHSPGLIFMQTAIRNEPWDALLVADVSPEGVKWSALPLTDAEVRHPESYDVDWWWAQQGKKEPYNWRLLPYQTMKTLRQPVFWYGMLAGILLVLVVRVLLRRIL
jgi:hypothetical protein